MRSWVRILFTLSAALLTSCTERAAAPPVEVPPALTGCAPVSGHPFFGKSVCFLATEELSLVEGDIVITPSSADSDREAVAITGGDFRWPDGIVPVEISPEISDVRSIILSMQEYADRTPVRFRPKRPTDTDYVAFVLAPPQAPGCGFSMVGRRGGRQEISLNPHCMTSHTILHEIGHTLGLWHEQSREDRDQFVMLNLANVEPDQQFNFDRKILNGDDIGSYDFGSIMHYGPNAFSLNPSIPTIVTRDSSKQSLIGTAVHLSGGDVRAIFNLYGLKVEVTERTATSAVIQWEAPISARGTLSVGTSTNELVSSNVVPSETRLPNGSFRYRALLTSLAMDTKYFYQVQVELLGYRTFISSVQNFSTDLRAPKILGANVRWDAVSKYYVLAWDTSEPSSQYAELMPVGDLALPFILDDQSNFSLHHEIVLPLFILGRNKDYRVTIQGMDAQGNAAQEKTLDFHTLNAAPFLTGLKHRTDHSSIFLEVNSDVPAEFKIRYGRHRLDQEYLPSGGAALQAKVTLTGLMERSWYFVRIEARDPVTNLVAKGPLLRVRTTDLVEILSVTDIPAKGRKPARLEVRASSSRPNGGLLRVELRNPSGELVYRTFMRRESIRTNNFVAQVPAQETGSLLVRSFKGGTAVRAIGISPPPLDGLPTEALLSF